MWAEVFKRWMNLVMWWLPQQQQPETSRDTPETDRPEPEQKESEPKERETRESPSQKDGTQGSPEPAPEPRAQTTASARPAPGGSEPQTAVETRSPSTAPAEESAPASRDEASTPKASGKPASPDALTEIKGIGPAMQQKLSALGITRFQELAEADAESLTEKLKASQRTITKQKVEGWIKEAHQKQSS